MAIFTCSKYPTMNILVKAEEQVMGAGGIVRTIPAVFKQFNKGRMKLDDEKEKDAIEAIRQNSDFGSLIREVNLQELAAMERAKSDADDTQVMCPYCLSKFDTLKRLMAHATECKDRKNELSGNAGRNVRGVQTTGG